MLNSPIMKRFLRRKVSVVAAIVLLLLILTAIFGPFLSKYSPSEQNLRNSRAPVSAEHWLGTDSLGRDTFTRLVYGARNTLAVSVSGALTGTFVGVLLGVFSGYFGKWVDTLISRFIEVLLSFPGLMLGIIVIAILGPGEINTAIVIAILCIPSISRITRGTVLTLKDSEYVQAAQIMGASNTRIIFTHIIPNAISLIIVTVTLNLGTSILTASSLSFLGLGVQPPNPEWGSMLATAREVVRYYPLGVLAPGLAITITVLSFSLVGDGLRDALDPKLKNR